MRKPILIFVLMFFAFSIANAKIRVVTTLSDLADLTKQVGGDKVDVDYIVRGTQNPHFIEVKPSYMLKLRNADIFVMIGMELELWAQQIIDGSRNSNLLVLDCSKGIQKIEIPVRLDASQGDVHRYGNPHYWLDPENAKVILQEILNILAQVSPSDHDYFKSNMDNYIKKLDAKITEWKKIMAPLKGAKFVAYHSSWSYFANRFGLVVAGFVEPKPGIPPTPSHTVELIQLVKEANIRVVVLEPFYDDSAPNQIARMTNATVLRLPTSVGGVDGVEDYLSLIDYDVKTLASALKG